MQFKFDNMSFWRFFYYSFPGIELEDESENSNLVLAGNLNWSLSYLITSIITCQFDDFFYFLFPGIELEDESEGEVISSELQKKEQERKRHQSNKNLVKTHKRTLSGGVVRTNLRPKHDLVKPAPSKCRIEK